MKKIFNSLGSNYDLSDAINALFASSEKKYCDELIKLLEKKYGGEVILTYKGREAIDLALQAAALPKDSTVAINGFTCYVVYKPVVDNKLDVAYLDVDKDTLNFSLKSFQDAIKKEKNICAVIIQNTLGAPIDIEAIEKICKKENIIIIEDLAHCIGSKYADGREAGTVGDFACLSFSQDKMLDAVSGGALIVGNSKFKIQNSELEIGDVDSYQQFKDKLYPLLTVIIRHTYSFGFGKALHHILKMFNFLSKPMGQKDRYLVHRLANWYAYLALLQLEKLDQNIAHRQKIAKIYAKSLDNSVLISDVTQKGSLSSNVRFPILVENRQGLIKFLQTFGIHISDIWYDAPIAPKKYLSMTNYNHNCPNAEYISDRILNLPTHKNITEKDAQFIVEKINEFLKSSNASTRSASISIS